MTSRCGVLPRDWPRDLVDKLTVKTDEIFRGTGCVRSHHRRVRVSIGMPVEGGPSRKL
jgi:hypothetical protein